MKHGIPVIFAACIACGVTGVSPAAQRGDDAPKVKLFVTHARLVVDAAGRVESVEPDTKLSSVVQQFIRTSAEGWAFEPPMQAGKAVGGSTHATLTGCAAEVDGELRMQVALLGTGPGAVGKAVAPSPALIASMLEANDMARFKLTYRVDPSGAAVLENVEQIEGRPALLRPVRLMSTRWLSKQRFIPEQLDGQPVATRMTTEMAIAGDSMVDNAKRNPVLLAQGERQRNCASALKAGSTNDATPVALDSPFRTRPGSS